MGASPARCCNVSTPAKDTSRSFNRPRPCCDSSSIASFSRIRNFKEYKENYQERGQLRVGCQVINVQSTEFDFDYACRKIKISDMPCKDMTYVAKHCRELATVDHPHVCKFVEAFEDKTHLYLLYEKANPVTLFEHIRQRSSLTEEEAADYLRQAAMALSVSHGNGVVHGRLCPRSLVLSQEEDDDDEECDTQLRICDLGQGWVLRPGPLGRGEVTPKVLEVETYAISPELACKDLQQPADGTIPKGADKHDIWALGVIFYHMLSGTVPFKVESRSDLVDQVGCKEVRFLDSMWSKLSPAARDVVESMLRLNPGIRISAAMILKHPWVKVAKTTFPKKRMVQLLSNLKSNVQECEFKRFVLRVIAEQLPRDGKTSDAVEQAFRALDRNGDGVLTVGEILKGVKKNLNISDSDRELERLFAAVDRDSSGNLNVQEFISACMDQRRSTSLPVLWEAFNAFDKDRSGSIDFAEIDRIVREIEGAALGKELAEQMAGEIRRELEGLGGSSLDFDQFVYIMLNSRPSAGNAARRDASRVLWACGVDCYRVRHFEPSRRWDLNKGQPGLQSPRSAYRKRDARRRESCEEPVEAG